MINQAVLDALADYYNLGHIAPECRAISVGLQHQKWQAKSAYGDLLIKQYSPKVYRGQLEAAYLEFCEVTAERLLQHDLPVAHGLQGPDGFIFNYEGACYSVREYIAAEVISQTHLRVEQFENLGRLLGQIHELNLTADEKTVLPSWHQPPCETRSGQYRLSHGDVTPCNVLWHRNKPILIDWESVDILDSGIEYIMTITNCINIAGQTPIFENIKPVSEGYQSVVGRLPIIASSHMDTIAHSWQSWISYLNKKQHDVNQYVLPLYQTEIRDSLKSLNHFLRYKNEILLRITT